MTVDPHAQDAERLKQIQVEIDADPEAYLSRTDALTNDDLILVGSIVQTFNYADLNARMIIDTIRHAALGAAKQNGGVVQDSQVYENLIAVAELFDPDDEFRVNLLRAATTFQLHHQMRHHFAHWAMRRIPNEDALFMMNYKSQEAEKRLGRRTEPGELTYGVLPLASYRVELEKLMGHARWLAVQASRVHEDFAKLEQLFAKKREAERAAKYEAGKYKRGAKGPPKPDQA